MIALRMIGTTIDNTNAIIITVDIIFLAFLLLNISSPLLLKLKGCMYYATRYNNNCFISLHAYRFK
jgi:hypothetical protein